MQTLHLNFTRFPKFYHYVRSEKFLQVFEIILRY